MNKKSYEVTYFVLLAVLGIFGAHKFYKKEWLMGTIYLFTLGLFFIGWGYDLIKYIIFVIDTMKENKEYDQIKIKEANL